VIEMQTIEWDSETLFEIAEKTRIAITGGKAVSLQEYQKLAASVPLKKIGYSFGWIVVNDPRMAYYLPAEIISAISARIKRYKFDAFAISFIKNHPEMTAAQIGSLLFVSPKVIAKKAKRLNIKLAKTRHVFSKDEDAIIKRYKKNPDKAAQLLGVNRAAILHRAGVLGIEVGKKKEPYKKRELVFLQTVNLDNCSDSSIARKLGRKPSAIARKRRALGVFRRNIFNWRNNPRKLEQMRCLLKKGLTYREIALKLGLTEAQVAKKAWRSKLKVS